MCNYEAGGKFRFGGVFLLILGTYFPLATFGVLPWDMIGRLWPIFIIAAGLGSIFQSLTAELHQSRRQLEESHRKLPEYARKVEDLAVLSERNRLAGEIHDGLGHNLTALSEQQYRLSPSVDVALYNAVQEALTNCAKHGQADSVAVDLRFQEHAVELWIRDNGRGSAQIGKGVGLKTMEERIGALGGRVTFSGGDGFAVNAVIPTGGS